MNIRDLFRLLIKLFGVYTLVTVIYALCSLIYVHLIAGTDLNLFLLLLTISVVLLIAIIYGLLLIKTDKVIDMLRLTKGFEDNKIEIQNFDTSNLLKIACVVAGLIILANNFPDFAYQCFFLIKSKISTNITTNDLYESLNIGFDYFGISISGISCLLGYVLLTNYARFARWVEKISKH